MPIKVDWALFRWAPTYGYSQVGGSLRASRVSSLIAKWSDVPSGSAGPDLPERAWAAWKLDDRYVLVRSVPDQEEDRGGGYISRALILSANQAAELSTLMPLFDLLERSDNFWTAQANQPIELEDALPVSATSSVVPALLTAYTKRGVKRIVLLDSLQTPLILSELWQTLWPAARLSLSFKTYFTPIQVSSQDDRPQLIISPTTAARWEAHDYETVTPTAQVNGPAFVEQLISKTNALAANLLMGYPEGLTDLPTLAVLFRQIETAFASEDAWSVLMALDTLQGVPVAVETRTKVCNQLYQSLRQRIPELPVTEFLHLDRLLHPPPFLIRAVERWITDRLLLEPELAKVLQQPTKAWLRAGIEAGVATISPSKAAAGQVWEHWSLLRDRSLLPAFFTDAWDPVLASTLPHDPPNDVRALALQHRLLDVYANFIGRQPHPAAMQEALREITPEDQPVVWQHLKARWGEQNFLQASAKLNDPRLDPLITGLLGQNSELLQFLDPTQASWRRWWTQRVLSGAAVWEGISDRTLIMDGLLGLAPADWPLPVLIAIADTPQANLLGQPHRRSLWRVLPAGFLRATAQAWLVTAALHEDVEPEILEEALAQVNGQIPPDLAIHLLRLSVSHVALPKLDLLLQSARAPWPEDLVLLLQQRAEQDHLIEGWFDRALSGRYNFPSSFFDPLFGHLRPLQKVRHLRASPEGIPDNLWWHALREKAVATFGDELERVWVDIGGKPKHLQHQGSRENRWYHAIQHMRDIGKPKSGDLLQMIGKEDRLSDDSKVLWETRPHHK